jgi:hypothetical protein
LKAGGVSTNQGQLLFEDFSKKVARSGFKPAATADILAVSYALLMLSGIQAVNVKSSRDIRIFRNQPSLLGLV